MDNFDLILVVDDIFVNLVIFLEVLNDVDFEVAIVIDGELVIS